MHMRKHATRALATLVLSIAPLYGSNADSKAAAAPSHAASAWDGYVDRFLEQHFQANPAFAVNAGRHEFDGRLPDYSADALRREVARLKQARADLDAFDTGVMTAQQRFERDYLRDVLDEKRFWIDEAQWPYRNPEYYLADLDPDAYLNRPYAPLETRMRAYIAYAQAVPRAAAQIRANLRTPLPSAWIEYGANAFGGFADFYANDVAASFADVKDSALQQQLKTADTAAAAAMRELADWLLAQKPQGTQDFAIGAAMFSRMLEATEQVKLPLERIAEIGRADLDRNTAALHAACQQLLPGGSVEACIAKVRVHKPLDGPVAEARRVLPTLEAFVRKSGLVSIPSDDKALVAEAPPYNAQNFAYINPPGPYEKTLPAIYYIAPPDPQWSAQQREQYVLPLASLTFVSIHEVWPGHFLQFLHSNRSHSRIGQLFVGYAFAEGWAHYAEETMWEAGFGNGDPELHVGQLMQALWRDVRFMSAIGLHTGKMSLAESEQMFRDVAFLDAGNARQQALRGTYDPAYLNYTLGKLMIRKLRDDWTATRGGRAAWHDFHDALLSYGAPPLPLVRRQMLGENAGPVL